MTPEEQQVLAQLHGNVARMFRRGTLPGTHARMQIDCTFRDGKPHTIGKEFRQQELVAAIKPQA